jgi:hypothetical protein
MLARRIARPYLEFIGLAHLTSVASVRSSPYAMAEERARQTIELARRHGWADEPAAGIAYIGPPSGFPCSCTRRTGRSRGPAHCGCTPWYGWAKPGAPSRTSRTSASKPAPAAKYTWR